MKKTVLTLSAAALALTGASALYAQRGMPETLDTNGDGAVTLAEMQAHGSAMFAKMDVNADGTLDAADRAAHKAEMFAKMDADGNGEVTQAEMKAAHVARMAGRAEARGRAVREARMAKHETRMAEMFAAADADKSGGLTAAELDAAHKDRREERKERRAEGGAHAKGEGHGMHHGGERMGGRHHGGHGGKGMMFLGRMGDSDGDKAVTRAEFDAALAAHFAKLDSDANGSVSDAEMKAAHAAMRAEWKARKAAKPAG